MLDTHIMNRLGTLVLSALVLAIFASGCDNYDPEDIVILVPRDVQSSQYTTLDNGLKYYDFEVGEGELVTDSSVVRVYYAAWLTNDRLISSASPPDREPIEVDLSSSNVVEGWIVGVPGMRVGGERQLVVPPSLAYGEEGFPDAGIPADATIVYEIDVVSIEN